MAKATKRRYLPATELLASLGGMAMIVMIGTRAYMYFDEHSFVPALYFTVRVTSAPRPAQWAEVRGSARAGHHGDDCRLWRHCAAVCRLPDLQHHLRADRSRVLCQRTQCDQWHPAPAEEGTTRRLCRLPSLSSRLKLARRLILLCVGACAGPEPVWQQALSVRFQQPQAIRRLGQGRQHEQK